MKFMLESRELASKKFKKLKKKLKKIRKRL